MKLTYATQTGETVVHENPSADEVGSLLLQASWDGYTSIKLEIDGENHIEAFGSNDLGISAAYAENGSVSNAASKNIEFAEIRAMFQSYLRQDMKWRGMIIWECAPRDCEMPLENVSMPGILTVLYGLVRLFFSVLFSGGRARTGSIIHVKDDEPEMAKAIGDARASLPEFLSAFEDRSGVYRDFALKVKITDAYGTEHIWLRDIEKENGELAGIVDNEPRSVMSVNFGQKITANQSEISDWGFFHENVGQGFFTVKALMKNLTRRERKLIGRNYGWPVKEYWGETFLFGKRKTKEEKFWEWFAENQERFLRMRPGDSEINGIVEEVGRKLSNVANGLEHEFSLSDKNGKRAFIVSAGGIRKNIPKVESLADSAPVFERWDIVKYKQRKELGGLIFGDSRFSADNIFFVLKRSEKIDIVLYFDDFEEDSENLFAHVCFIVLDGTLGEYDVMTLVGKIDWKSKSDAPDDAMPISRLAEMFDQMAKRKR